MKSFWRAVEMNVGREGGPQECKFPWRPQASGSPGPGVTGD